MKAIIKSSMSISQDSEMTSLSTNKLKSDVSKLKRILAREYATFFEPMYTEYYSPSVTFNDPMTSLSGVESYQKNVDMLASRTFMGQVLFSDAGIVLHNGKELGSYCL